MNTNDTLNPSEVESRTAGSFMEAEAAHERAEVIDRIGDMISGQLERVHWPETKQVLHDLLERCRDLIETAHADQDDAKRRYDEARRDVKALQGD